MVKQLVIQSQQDAEDFEEMALAFAPEGNASAALGAKKAAVQARQQLIPLLQATGRLPRRSGVLADVGDLHEIAREMVDTVRGFRRGEVEAEDVEEAFKRVAGIGRRHPQAGQATA